MNCLKSAFLASALSAALVMPAGAQTADEFYKGKTVTIAVGYTAGGGYDIYARLLARYLGKYIPGNPSIIVENMPGASSLTLANHLANTAPRDGTVIGSVGRGIPVEPLLGVVETRYDTQALNWIGSMTDEVAVCVAWHSSAVDNWSQVMDGSQQLVIGGNGAAADNEVYPRMLIKLVDANMKIISGYPGASEVALAMEQGEIDGQCGSWGVISGYSDWLETGKIKVLLQLGGEPLPGMEDVPQVMDFAKDDEQAQVLSFILSRLETARPFVAPPDIPEERVELLRTAFMAALADPDLIAEAEKMALELKPMSGQAVAELIDSLYAAPENVLARSREIIAVD